MTLPARSARPPSPLLSSAMGSWRAARELSREIGVPAAHPPPVGCWLTRDGRLVAICEMEDDHLANSIRMIRRGRIAAGYRWRRSWDALAYAATAPDGAAMAAEESSESYLSDPAAVDEDVEKEIPAFGQLLAEARTRRLPVRGWYAPGDSRSRLAAMGETGSAWLYWQLEEEEKSGGRG